MIGQAVLPNHTLPGFTFITHVSIQFPQQNNGHLPAPSSRSRRSPDTLDWCSVRAHRQQSEPWSPMLPQVWLQGEAPVSQVQAG